MKKVLSIALALVMILSLSVTAFADAGSTGLSQTTSSGDISVQAKIVPMISAQVDWGDMQFTYYEQGELWNANNTNGVTVTNTTTGRSIDTRYSYARYNDKGETTMTAGWVESDESLWNPGVYDIVTGDYVNYMGSLTTRALNNLGTTLEELTGDVLNLHIVALADESTADDFLA